MNNAFSSLVAFLGTCFMLLLVMAVPLFLLSIPIALVMLIRLNWKLKREAEAEAESERLFKLQMEREKPWWEDSQRHFHNTIRRWRAEGNRTTYYYPPPHFLSIEAYEAWKKAGGTVECS